MMKTWTTPSFITFTIAQINQQIVAVANSNCIRKYFK